MECVLVEDVDFAGHFCWVGLLAVRVFLLERWYLSEMLACVDGLKARLVAEGPCGMDWDWELIMDTY